MSHDPPQGPDRTAPDMSAWPPYPLAMRDKIAQELYQLREDMENLGVQLCLDEAVMVRCMPHLQRLDEMGQRTMWLAELLRAENPAAIIPEITLQALADRLEDLRRAISFPPVIEEQKNTSSAA
ncbi:MAG: hypothetical protein E2598_11045 [Sphingobium sp.]|nr:hypothetical protein [Sphingobium sp.]